MTCLEGNEVGIAAFILYLSDEVDGITAAGESSVFHVTQNRLPFPSSLCTPKSPSLIVTKCLQIERPRPVPSWGLVIDESPCAKLSQISFMNVASMLQIYYIKVKTYHSFGHC